MADSKTTKAQDALQERCANTLRGLAIDAVQRANSGHPGMPMGMADVATVLFTEFMRFDAAAPTWPDRDRFVLSAGHGSALLYSMLHMLGYDVTLDDLRAFRQWGSRTPGHPEFGHTVGVEATTGPLGQGVAMAVGMALAEARLRAEFGPELCDHRTFVIAGDGCMMEGISAEAAGFAGHLGLGRLIVLYDDNGITIDGSTAIAFSDHVGARYAAQGWRVLSCDGHDRGAVRAALQDAVDASDAADGRPTLICCKTEIGHHSPRYAGQSRTHGSPLGPDEVAATKTVMGLDPTAEFDIARDVAAHMLARGSAGQTQRRAWRDRLKQHPRGAELLARLEPDREALAAAVAWPSQPAGAQLATRKASQKTIAAIAQVLPGLIGGSADLEESNGTHIGGEGHIARDALRVRNVHYGVREHAMAAIANGLSLHGGHLPFVGTFLVFHDYMRPAVRLSALMRQSVIYVYTHDSIFLGEDGPTHQPVETLLALRSVPGMHTYRPADLAETAACWRLALERSDGPSALCLTRQNLPELEHPGGADAILAGVRAGAYVLCEAPDDLPLAVVILASGSEVALALQTRERLRGDGVGARVVSVPCCERVDALDKGARAAILGLSGPGARPLRVSVEAGVSRGWERYVGEDGLMIAIDSFGASAPAPVLAREFGFTAEAIAARVLERLRA